jgi:phosphatidylglycerophosphate synthase
MITMYLPLCSLTIALVALAIFATRDASSRLGGNAAVQKHSSSPFLGRLLVEFGYYVVSPVAKVAVALRVSPNVSSWACLTLGVCAGIAAGLGLVPLAGGLLLASAVFDMLDGVIARSRGVASDAGEVLDAAVDRYTEFFFLGGLCIYYRQEVWALILVLSALLGSMMISYSQAKAESLDIDIPNGWMRRPERAAYLGGGAFLSPIVTEWFEPGVLTPLHYPFLVATLIIAVVANATAVHRFVILYASAKARRSADR